MAGGSSIKKEDRLFSLILALVATRDGLTKTDIYRSVHGYSERYEHDTDSTLDKLFERDKKDLREMGVVIDTFELAGDEGLTHHVRYSISAEAYELPDGITFTPREMSLLQLSASVWRELALGDNARHALNKLRSLGVQPDSSLNFVAPRIGVVERSFTVVTDALVNELVLEFAYDKPGEDIPRIRRVSPLGIANWHDRWFVLAWDLDAQAERTFLLSRIRGNIRHVPQISHARAGEDYATRLVHELDHRAIANAITLSCDANPDLRYLLERWGAHFDEDQTWHVPCADVELLAEELLPLWGSVTATNSAELRGAVHRRLVGILARHSGEVVV